MHAVPERAAVPASRPKREVGRLAPAPVWVSDVSCEAEAERI
jgi:hypothetical protein